jgi:hypothetical protein
MGFDGVANDAERAAIVQYLAGTQVNPIRVLHVCGAYRNWLDQGDPQHLLALSRTPRDRAADLARPMRERQNLHGRIDSNRSVE